MLNFCKTSENLLSSFDRCNKKWTLRFHLRMLFFFYYYFIPHSFIPVFFKKKKNCYQRDVDSLRLCSIRLLFRLVIVSASLGCMSALLKGFFSSIAEVERDLGFQSWSKWGSQCRLSEDLNCRMVGGCGESATKVERKRKLLNWLICPLDETPKIDELAKNPSMAFSEFAWQPKTDNGHLGHCWVVIDKKCLQLNNMVRREQHCALVLAGGGCKVEFNSDSCPTAKKAVPYWWSANTPSRTHPAACT